MNNRHPDEQEKLKLKMTISVLRENNAELVTRIARYRKERDALIRDNIRLARRINEIEEPDKISQLSKTARIGDRQVSKASLIRRTNLVGKILRWGKGPLTMG